MNILDELEQNRKAIIQKILNGKLTAPQHELKMWHNQLQEVDRLMKKIKAETQSIPAPVTLPKKRSLQEMATMQKIEVSNETRRLLQMHGPIAPPLAPRVANIGLNDQWQLRCSLETTQVGTKCPSISCAHREQWLDKRESVGSFGRYCPKEIGKSESRLVHLPICNGLLRASVLITVTRTDGDGVEGSRQFVASHFMRCDRVNPVVQIELVPRKGDTLRTAIKAIESFYQSQPEYYELDGWLGAVHDLPCAIGDSHQPGDLLLLNDGLAKCADVNMEGDPSEPITGDSFVQNILQTAQSFARLNTHISPEPPGMCISCWRISNSAQLR